MSDVEAEYHLALKLERRAYREYQTALVNGHCAAGQYIRYLERACATSDARLAFAKVRLEAQLGVLFGPVVQSSGQHY